MKRLVIVLLACVASAQAQDIDEVVIQAHPLSEEGLSQSVDVLKDEELEDNLESSLGETVGYLPGVRNASFGQAVGRPVIRGLGGPRVKTTQDQIDTLDVSVTSTDHVVSVDPFMADQVSVLKGASTLLYGSGAIGGVVDTETGRIPLASEIDGVSGRFEYRFTDNADLEAGSFRVDGANDNGFAWHLDAFDRSADNYDIPVGAESAAQLAAEGEEAEEGAGELESSFFDANGGAFGFSIEKDWGFVGASISRQKANYGLVGGHGHGHEEEGHHDEDEDHHDEDEDHHDEDEEHHDEDEDHHDEDEEHHDDEDEHHDEEEEEGAELDMEQTRIDLEAQLNNPFSGFKYLNFRIGLNDYEHVEIEGEGEIGTMFDNDAWEARLLAAHENIAGFDGAFGLQLGSRDFSATGEEAFVPPVETDTAALFWVGQRDFANGSLELGLRLEDTDHQSSTGVSRDFSTTSASAGWVYDINEGNRFTALIDFTERAPSVEELFSNGPHLATNSFEIGNANLVEESGVSYSLGWTFDSQKVDVNASVYYVDYSDFIYQIGTGEEEDELPVLVYLQDDAEFTGFDFELAWHLGQVLGGDLDLGLEADTVSADLDAGGNLPRIPADRQRVKLSWESDEWRTSIAWTNTSSQNDVANFELATPGYDDVTVKINRTWEIEGKTVVFFLNGKNLGDEEQREHVSFVKDFTPLPGRRVEAGVRVKF